MYSHNINTHLDYLVRSASRKMLLWKCRQQETPFGHREVSLYLLWLILRCNGKGTKEGTLRKIFLFKHDVFFTNSDKTDVESTHSSNISGYKHGNNGYMEKTAVIPPDALYATTTKKLQQNRNSFYAPPPNAMHPQQIQQHQQSPSSYAYDPSFEDSKVRIHTFSRKHLPLNSSLNQHHIVSNHYVNTTERSSNHLNNGSYNWQHAVLLLQYPMTTRCHEQQHAWILQE